MKALLFSMLLLFSLSRAHALEFFTSKRAVKDNSPACSRIKKVKSPWRGYKLKDKKKYACYSCK